MPVPTRPTPDQLLRQVQAEEEFTGRGRLKVFLGYASGVGKSFRMFDEGRRRRERGQDVVVGAMQTQSASDVEGIRQALTAVPMRRIGDTPVVDVEQILGRHPQVCLIDGLAYDNPPEAPNRHRWQDVEQLLEAGIAVLTTINVQYVEERREQVAKIRGKTVSVSVPESFLRKADEIVVVDAPADFSVGRTDGSAADMHSEPGDRDKTLSQLREIALLLAADVVEEQLEAHLERQGVSQSWATQERILVCVTPRANAGRMLDRARLICDRFHGELFVLYVGQSDLSSDDQLALERNLAIARAKGAQVKLLTAADPAKAIISFAQEQGITQIFVGHSPNENWRARFTKTFVERLIRDAEGIDVKLFPH